MKPTSSDRLPDIFASNPSAAPAGPKYARTGAREVRRTAPWMMLLTPLILACGGSPVGGQPAVGLGSAGAPGAPQPLGAAGGAGATTSGGAGGAGARPSDGTGGAGGSGPSCPVPVDRVCAAMPQGQGGLTSCAPTWSAVIPEAGNCARMIAEWTQDCGPYKSRWLVQADVGTVYYYDATSGALVAIVSLTNPLVQRCLAGPGDFVIPTSCGPVQSTPCSPADAGAD
jgi:hypothetical protein